MKGLGGLMKQAQEMQENMAQVQEDIAKMEVVGNAGGGLVQVTMSGKHQMLKVHIDDSLIGDDKDMLEDLVAAACNDAAQKVAVATKEKYQEITGGLNLPGGFQMPF